MDGINLKIYKQFQSQYRFVCECICAAYAKLAIRESATAPLTEEK